MMPHLTHMKDNLYLVNALNHSCIWGKGECKHTLHPWGRTVSFHVAFVDTASCLADQDRGFHQMWDPCAVAFPWMQEQLYWLALGFCSALCRQDEHVGVRLHVSCGAHGKTHHPGLTWSCWEGFFFSLCLWWRAKTTVQKWLHMLFLPLFLSHFLFQMISLQTKEDGVFAENIFFMELALQICLKFKRKDNLAAPD